MSLCAVPGTVRSMKGLKTRLVRFVDGLVHDHGLVKVLPADVDVRGAGTHRVTGEQAALYQLVRVLAHDLAVLQKQHAKGVPEGVKAVAV